MGEIAAAPEIAMSAIPAVGAEVGGTTLAALPGLTEAAGAVPGAFLGAAGSSAEPIFAGAAQGPWAFPFMASSPDFTPGYGAPGGEPIGGGFGDLGRWGNTAMEALKNLAQFMQFGKRAGLSREAFPFAAADTGMPAGGSGYAGGGLVESNALARLLGGGAGKPSTASSSATVPGATPPGGLTANLPSTGPGALGGGDVNQQLMDALKAMLSQSGGGY